MEPWFYKEKLDADHSVAKRLTKIRRIRIHEHRLSSLFSLTNTGLCLLNLRETVYEKLEKHTSSREVKLLNH